MLDKTVIRIPLGPVTHPLPNNKTERVRAESSHTMKVPHVSINHLITTQNKLFGLETVYFKRRIVASNLVPVSCRETGVNQDRTQRVEALSRIESCLFTGVPFSSRAFERY